METIQIKGDVVPFKIQEWDSEFEYLTNEEEVLNQLEGKTGDILVEIDSRGGDVDEGFKIYSALRRYAKENNAKVTTKAVGRCDSIAISIFLAGDKRIANKFLEPFAHNPFTYIWDDADKNVLKKAYDDISNYTNRIANHYAEHTKLTVEEALELMDNDTFISPAEMVELGFAHETEEILRPVALNKILNKRIKNKSNDTMSKKEEGAFNKFAEAMKKALGASNSAKNLVELSTATGDLISFNDLEEGKEPSVGDKATIDGENANGEFLMQDGSTFVFSNGVLEEIREKEEEPNEEVENLKENLADLSAKFDELLKTVNNHVETSTKAIKENQGIMNKLKNIASTYTEDIGKDNEDKSDTPDKKELKGLAGAVSNLKKSK